MRRIRLTFKSVSEIIGSEEIGLLILVDEQEERQIAIPCDKAMLYQFGLRLRHAPEVSRLLPEALWQIIVTQTELKFEILITDIIDGQYRALLYNTETLDPVAVQACDAVLLSHIGRVPIYIEETLMQKQGTAYSHDARGMAIPVNTISTEMLQSALERAVEDEKYELASHLRDELKRRSRQ